MKTAHAAWAAALVAAVGASARAAVCGPVAVPRPPVGRVAADYVRAKVDIPYLEETLIPNIDRWIASAVRDKDATLQETMERAKADSERKLAGHKESLPRLRQELARLRPTLVEKVDDRIAERKGARFYDILDLLEEHDYHRYEIPCGRGQTPQEED
ncbi:MAG: hypothetical protein HY078_08940 [Elusimicrobia bacterium]|nr:hypothetical protein [Elusimicrobiota bacterium]